MRIIPAIDIIEGKCVRLSQGNYAKKTVYSDNPLEIAQRFEDFGIRHLHVVDLEGAKADKIINYKALEQLAKRTRLKIDFGGGLKSTEDLRIAFECGASQITGGSIAVQQPELFLEWVQTYGSEKIILGADVRDEKIATSGWLETSDQKLLPFLDNYFDQGIRNVICTDISKDGMLQGPSIDLYCKILDQLPEVNLFASGGVQQLGDLEVLNEIGCKGVIIGKALYENRITLKELTTFI